MPVETADDRAAFLNEDEFGASASYTAEGLAAVTIAGIYDDAYFRIVQDFVGGVASAQPAFLCRSADLPATAAQGDALEITDPLTGDVTSYIVDDLQPDGTGMTRLVLTLAETD